MEQPAEFRTQMKYKSAKVEDRQKVMSDIIEGLRSDAADLARDIGIEELLGENGLKLWRALLSNHEGHGLLLDGSLSFGWISHSVHA